MFDFTEEVPAQGTLSLSLAQTSDQVPDNVRSFFEAQGLPVRSMHVSATKNVVCTFSEEDGVQAFLVSPDGIEKFSKNNMPKEFGLIKTTEAFSAFLKNAWAKVSSYSTTTIVSQTQEVDGVTQEIDCTTESSKTSFMLQIFQKLCGGMKSSTTPSIYATGGTVIGGAINAPSAGGAMISIGGSGAIGGAPNSGHSGDGFIAGIHARSEQQYQEMVNKQNPGTCIAPVSTQLAGGMVGAGLNAIRSAPGCVATGPFVGPCMGTAVFTGFTTGMAGTAIAPCAFPNQFGK